MGGSAVRGAWAFAVVAAALLPWGSGCSTPGTGRVARVGRASREEWASFAGERWVQAAFFGASGVEASAEELEEIWPTWGAGRVRGGGEPALRRVAGRHGLAAANCRLGREGLRQALDDGTCVLVVLPGDGKGRGRLAIPVAWSGGTVETRGAGGALEHWDEEAFLAAWGASGERGMVLISADAASKRLPENREAQLALGGYWLDTGNAERAKTAYEAAAEGDEAGDARGALGAGTACGREGCWQEAWEHFETALALEPDNPRAMNNAAYARLRRGDNPTEALRLAEAALAAHPRNPAYLETKAEALLVLGGEERAVEAARCLERAWKEVSRDSPGEMQREILEQLTRAWLASGRPDLARQVWAAKERAFPGGTPPPGLSGLTGNREF